MNKERLARLYDGLTPQERVPLLVAAAARADTVEQERLAQSAPTVDRRFSDYRGLARGFYDLVQFYLLQQVDLAAEFWHNVALLQRTDAVRDSPPQQREEEMLYKTSRFLAFRSVVLADAWSLFCSDWNLDAEVLPRLLPGFESVRLMLEVARPLAFGADEALAYLREVVETGSSEASTKPGRRREYLIEEAADVVRSLSEFLQERLVYGC